MTHNLATFSPNWVSQPGSTISDILQERKIPVRVFADQMNQPLGFINHLLEGNTLITQAIASQLTKVLGASEQFWLNRQSQYNQMLGVSQKIDEQTWLKDIPLKEMIKWGWIPDSEDKLTTCLEFFGVSSVTSWQEKYEREVDSVAFRTSATFESEFGALTAWLRQGERIGQSLGCSPWNATAFEESLEQIKPLTKDKDPKRFLPKLRKICASCGVAIAVVPTPKGCKASGATRFLTPDRALLLLSFRYRSDDHFWFTFFHEAGHLLLHENTIREQTNAFLEGMPVNTLQKCAKSQEEEANTFASEMLIPYHLQPRLEKLRGNTRAIISFAHEAGISPGIVVGQMQHRRIIQRNYLNGFKRRYDWNDILHQESN